MKLSLLNLFCLASLASVHADSAATADSHQAEVIDTIAFGSCFNPRSQQSAIFDGILLQEPDVFVFLGDNIYADTEDMDLFQQKYDELAAIPSYQKLEAKAQILATWDDHDYGVNDGGKSFKKRKEAEELFLNFFGDAADSPRRQREGIYGSYTFGSEGKVCQIILLDTRYFRDELPRLGKGKKREGTVGWYGPTEDTSKTLLGHAQWAWLEEQLQVPADLRIIGSSIQVLADEKGMENWGHVPHERKRLFDLLHRYQSNQTIFISGDVHFGELSKAESHGYPIYDMTSSGMSGARLNWAQAINNYRVGEAHAVFNAGLIEIDWKAGQLKLSFINHHGEKLATHVIPFGELSYSSKRCGCSG